MFTVYRLVDQRGDAVRYIGITDDVYKRFSQHLQCNENNLDKNEWIHDLKIHHIMLVMFTIEVVETVEEAREREQHWIHHYLRQGAKLLNVDIASSFSYDDFLAVFGSRPKHQAKVTAPARPGEAKKRAIRILRKSPGIGASALAKQANISRSYATQILSGK